MFELVKCHGIIYGISIVGLYRSPCFIHAPRILMIHYLLSLTISKHPKILMCVCTYSSRVCVCDLYKNYVIGFLLRILSIRFFPAPLLITGYTFSPLSLSTEGEPHTEGACSWTLDQVQTTPTHLFSRRSFIK